MKFLVPQGIGDSVWALLKAPDIAKKIGDGVVDILLNYQQLSDSEMRAREFVARFRFVRSVEMYEASILKPGDPTDVDGIPRYIDSGPSELSGVDYVLVANGHLHRGERIETWLPEFELNWSLIQEFQFTLSDVQKADELWAGAGPSIVFSMGNLAQNTTDGHNRNGIWTPQDWIDVGNWAVDKYGVKVVLLGGPEDVSYADTRILPHVDRDHWFDLIGRTGIGETFAIARKARYLLAYQSGIGIMSQYMGVPCGVFWRQKGDSFSPSMYMTNESSMASAWTCPAFAERHTPLLYGIDGVEQVKAAIERQMGQ